ncbi:MAG: CHASE2 domain-containing protein, partial [bacterium]|nr:CHASE2 domain-containing protein [bacterium]
MRKIVRNQICVRALLVFAAFVITVLLYAVGLFDGLELKSYDFRFKVRGSSPAKDSNIVLVTIDDQTFSSLKLKWPFPRAYFARAIENLAAAGAAAIVLDVEFTEPSSIDPYDDLSLQHAIARFPRVVLAGKMVAEYGSHQTLNRYPLKPLRPLLEAGACWGYANVYLDSDGFIRRYNLFQKLNQRFYYPLAVETLCFIQNMPTKNVAIANDGSLTVGKFSISNYEFDTMLINYIGPARSFPTYSFVNILDDSQFSLPDEAEDTDIFEIYKESGIFQDKIVMVGASAEELQDNKLTPFFHFDGVKQLMPGVEMHANALHTIIDQRFIVPASPLAILAITLLLGLISFYISLKLKPLYGMIAAGGTLIVYALACIWVFVVLSIWVLLIFPVVVFGISYGANVIHSILVEQREKGRYRKTFQQYVARSVVDSMLSSGELPKFGGERKVLTVLFSDIRSFTSYSE